MTNNDPNRWLRYDPERNISRHSATDPQKCREMQKKYGWKLIDIEEIENKFIFEVDCVFQGKTEFPNYLEEKEEELCTSTLFFRLNQVRVKAGDKESSNTAKL